MRTDRRGRNWTHIGTQKGEGVCHKKGPDAPRKRLPFEEKKECGAKKAGKEHGLMGKRRIKPKKKIGGGGKKNFYTLSPAGKSVLLN